jgi:hypothetical protein
VQKSRLNENVKRSSGGRGLKSVLSLIDTLIYLINHFFRNVKLLSFVGDEDEAEEEEATNFTKKPIYRPERMAIIFHRISLSI